MKKKRKALYIDFQTFCHSFIGSQKDMHTGFLKDDVGGDLLCLRLVVLEAVQNLMDAVPVVGLRELGDGHREVMKSK